MVGSDFKLAIPQSKLLGKFRLTGDRAKYSMYSILYIDDDVTYIVDGRSNVIMC